MAAPVRGPKITRVEFTAPQGGNNLIVKITVHNYSTSTTYSTQGPDPDTKIYSEGQTYLDVSDPYPGTAGRLRVGVDFDNNSGTPYPYRWGLKNSLGPRGEVTVTCQITLTKPGTQNYWAVLIQEDGGLGQVLTSESDIQRISITVPAANTNTMIVMAPVTRLEGHLKVEVALTPPINTSDPFIVNDAKSSGTLFRGLKTILQGRDPRHAALLTQRICGVCPIPHATAAAKALENAAVLPGEMFPLPTKARLMRNLALGVNFLQSHIFSFYQLALLDYVQGPAMPPWTEGYTTGPRLTPAENEAYFVNYVKALAINRKCQEIGAILAGKLPHAPGFVAGGMTATPIAADLDRFGLVLQEISSFLSVYLSDVISLGTVYHDYYDPMGAGPGNYLCFGGFDLGDGTQLFRSGVVSGGTAVASLEESFITEYVQRSWYTAASVDEHPSVGSTVPSPGKLGAYSWVKAPRYNGMVYEVGALARMMVNSGLYPSFNPTEMVIVQGVQAVKSKDGAASPIREALMHCSRKARGSF